MKMKTPKNQKITTSNVKILNPHDSQGNHVTDSDGIYPCLRGCGGAGYQQGYVLQHIHAVDCYNLCETGDIGRCLSTNGGELNEHIPVVMYGRKDCNTDQHDGSGQGNEG